MAKVVASKREWEKALVSQMIALYCRKNAFLPPSFGSLPCD